MEVLNTGDRVEELGFWEEPACSESGSEDIEGEVEEVDTPVTGGLNFEDDSLQSLTKPWNNETKLSVVQTESLDQTDSTRVTQLQAEKSWKTDREDDLNTKPKKKKKKIVFYVKDARYDVIKKIGKKEFNFRNTYKDEEESSLIWSDVGLQPKRIQNMKPFQ